MLLVKEAFRGVLPHGDPTCLLGCPDQPGHYAFPRHKAEPCCWTGQPGGAAESAGGGGGWTEGAQALESSKPGFALTLGKHCASVPCLEMGVMARVGTMMS